MKKGIFGLAVLFSVLAISASAQALKIGYIDPQEVLIKMPEYAAVERKLQNFADRKRDEFGRLQADFEKRVADYEQKMAVLSTDARTKEEQALDELRTTLMDFQNKYQEDLMAEQQTQLTPLFDKIEQGIAAVAKEMGLTFVINPRTSTGDVILLYISDEAKQTLNITQRVIDYLDL